MFNILLKEKPYIRIVDANKPSNTQRLKLSEESWKKYKKFKESSAIPVHIDYTVWECGNCGRKAITEEGLSMKIAESMICVRQEVCEQPDFRKVPESERTLYPVGVMR